MWRISISVNRASTSPASFTASLTLDMASRSSHQLTYEGILIPRLLAEQRLCCRVVGVGRVRRHLCRAVLTTGRGERDPPAAAERRKSPASSPSNSQKLPSSGWKQGRGPQAPSLGTVTGAEITREYPGTGDMSIYWECTWKPSRGLKKITWYGSPQHCAPPKICTRVSKFENMHPNNQIKLETADPIREILQNWTAISGCLHPDPVHPISKADVMVKSAAVPVMVRAVPRACGASQQHAKKFVTGSQQWSVGAGSAERSCNTNPMTPSTNQGLRPNTSSLRPVCHGTAAVLSAPHVAHITANSFASMRKMSSAAQHRQAEDGSQGQQGWNASAAWALGCASIVAGLGHVLSEDNVKAEAAPAPTAVAVAVATIDTVPEALETIAKLGGSPAKDIPSAIKLVASKALLDNASHEVRRDTLLALAVLLSTKEGEANVSVLLKAGAVKSCFTILSDASSSPETLAGAATLLANLNTFQGGWFCSPAHKEKDWQAAVKVQSAWPHPMQFP